MKIKLTTLLLITVFIACKTDPNKQIDEGKITESTYHSVEIGWTMEIPKGWDIIHKSVLDERTDLDSNGDKPKTVPPLPGERTF